MQRATAHYAAGRLEEASADCDQVLLQQPRHPKALHLKALLLMREGKSLESIQLLELAITIAPNAAILYTSLGRAQHQAGGLNDAIASFRKAVALKPDNARAWLGLGHLLQEAGSLADAIKAFRASTMHDPQLVDAWTGLGIALAFDRKLVESREALQRATELGPDLPHTHFNLAKAQQACSQYEEAIASLRRAIELDPRDAGPWLNLGNVLTESGRVDEALSAQRRASSLAPNAAAVRASILLTMLYHPRVTPHEQFEMSRRWGEEFGRIAESNHRNDRDPDRLLRIGYLSGDYRAHPVPSFLENILVGHDRSQFRVIAFNNSRSFDHVSAKLKAEVDEWHDVGALRDDAATATIRDAKTDILVDLSGFTGDGRPLVVARGPAPVQFNYLGYPATSGMPAVQYRLTDAVADPPGMTESHFTETLVRLPGCFLCYRPDDDAPAPLDATPAQASGYVTFGSFNNLPKVTDEMIALWARIMQAVPGSRFLMKTRPLALASARQRIIDAFMANGISADRLQLLGWTEYSQRHAIVASADIALDSFPYSGTTTTCEVLWLGVPWVTLAGRSHVSRVSASILTSVGIPELIANTPDDYVDKAIILAGDVERLSQYRRTLRDMMRKSPLLDPAGFVRNLESVYREAWRNWCAAGLQTK